MTAYIIPGRGADVSIGPDVDNKETSLLPNGGSEGYGENEGASLLFCSPAGAWLGQFAFATGS